MEVEHDLNNVEDMERTDHYVRFWKKGPVTSEWFMTGKRIVDNCVAKVIIPRGYKNDCVFSLFLVTFGQEQNQVVFTGNPSFTAYLSISLKWFSDRRYYVTYDPEKVKGEILWNHYTVFCPTVRSERRRLLNEILTIINSELQLYYSEL